MGDALVVPGVRPGNAVNKALEPRRLGPRELGVGQVDVVDHLGESLQAGVRQAKPRYERFEGAAIALMGVFRFEHIETYFVGLGLVRPFLDEPEAGFGVDEAPDEPGARNAVHVDASTGNPGAPRLSPARPSLGGRLDFGPGRAAS